MRALTECIDKIPWDEPSEVLLSVSDAIERSMGGTSGAIYTLLLTSGSRVIGRGECLSKWVESLMEGIRAIKQYGGADVGDRTMLDSLVPAAKALQRFITDSSSPLDALKAAVEAAKQGTADTLGMKAGAGRASYVHSSQLTQVDPGARAVDIWLEAILTALSD
ncbi:PREDICTED: triokinase/FMN cyclase-like [Amphimedon queenslandica]|uniref:DhaL domain-containing protein n=1 Tax=Amphimedon queenslandica TaxID=400682 RepID=A0AAN0JEU1_AMPQE|nr:PREDICTED: triokinase/FMN cyclase-like [Amphimedon queenslandica]|eukprot:XP_019855286.1 PREDICTED: triokinase/FMN cyclase-like [Amphimedon queenslandica]